MGRPNLGGGGGLVTKSCLTLVIPWTVACQAPLSMGFSRQDYWEWVAISFSGDFCVLILYPSNVTIFID